MLCLCAAASVLADTNRDGVAMLPFEPSEQLIYEGEFSKLLLRGVTLAELRFTAERTVAEAPDKAETKAESQPTVNLRFTVEAVSKGWFRKLFGIHFRYLVQSIVEPFSLAVVRTTTLDEQGRRLRTSETVYNRTSGSLVWTERDPNDPARPPRVVASSLNNQATSDLAFALYYLRTQPLVLGESFEFTMSDSGQIYRIPVEVVEKKRIKTVLGEVSTIRVNVDVFGDKRLVNGQGKMSVWFTDDRRRIPVRAEISSEMGTLDITLKRVTNGTQA
ncbi:MAG: DUF3108 domain-containing protein [Pyrinomonadaceae bacterium]|nr:DUF3108 domain-containing protein [Pyrinomonadaceae bacterium]